MSHWKSIHIQSFRRLENLRLEGLGSVNLLVGKNNSGKTSVLEAMAIACHPTDAFTWIDIGREREMKSARTPVLELLNSFFPRVRQRENGFDGYVAVSGEMDSGSCVGFEAEYLEFRELELDPRPSRVEEGGDDLDLEPSGSDEEESEFAATLDITLSRWEPADSKREQIASVRHRFSGRRFRDSSAASRITPCQFISPVSHRTSRQLLAAVDQVVGDRLKSRVIALIQKLAPDVEEIDIRSPKGRGALVHLYHSGIGYVPLAAEGDGMRRALSFASASVQARGGILLLDEVETALHPDALAGIFGFLVEICREENVQLFVTTHSLEAVDAMIESAEGIVPDLTAYRLPERGSNFAVKRFTSQTLRDLRFEGGLDIR